MRLTRLARPLATVAIGLGLVGVQLASTGAAGASTHDHHAAYTCSGGNIPAGHYESVIVTGVCYTPSGNVWIEHSLIVKPGALLDAVTPGDPTSGTPVVPATVNVGGNVWVGKGGVLLLGCSPNIACGNPPGISFDHIGGNLTAVGAQGVVLHSVSVEGNVLVWGGGGGAAADTCAAQTPGNPVNTGLEPWSLDASLYFTPVYTDIEDSSIGGISRSPGWTRAISGRSATRSGATPSSSTTPSAILTRRRSTPTGSTASSVARTTPLRRSSATAGLRRTSSSTTPTASAPSP